MEMDTLLQAGVALILRRCEIKATPTCSVFNTLLALLESFLHLVPMDQSLYLSKLF